MAPRVRYAFGMGILVRAVISGFGLALGSALYHKVARKLGFEEENEKKTDQAADASVVPTNGDNQERAAA